MGIVRYAALIALCFTSADLLAAKIYKCKDASGKTVFSNFQCTNGSAERGYVGSDNPGSPQTHQPTHRPVSSDGLTPSERQLKALQDQRKDALIMNRMRQQAAREKALHEQQMQAQREHQQRAEQINKADCEYYKVRADYYENEAKQKGLSKSDKLLYKSAQKSFESDIAKECN